MRILAWVEKNVLSINDCSDAAVIRKALDMLALHLDSNAATPNTIARRREIVYEMLKYAIELKRLDTHPSTYVSWTTPKADDQIDRRTVPPGRHLHGSSSTLRGTSAQTSRPSSGTCTTQHSDPRKHYT